MKPTLKDFNRFWKKVYKDPITGCWNWMAYLDRDGYGSFGFRKDGKDVRTRAHRFSYMYIGNKSIPQSMVVCHSCDNPKCVNPEHLWTGTQQDNIDDAVKKNRNVKGPTQGQAKFTEQEVRAIRQRYKELGEFRGVIRQISKEFGKGNVRGIIRNIGYKDII